MTLGTTVWQHEVNGYVFGPETSWGITKGFAAWWSLPVRDQDYALDLENGSVPGTDTQGPRSFVFDVETTGITTAADAAAAMADLADAFAPGASVELHAILPDADAGPSGHVKVIGRCRGAEFDADSDLTLGKVTGQVFFVAHSPTISEVTP